MVHGCTVYAERAETAAVSRGTSHVTTKQCCRDILHHSDGYSEGIVKSYSHSFRVMDLCIYRSMFRVTCDKSAVSLLESGE